MPTTTPSQAAEESGRTSTDRLTAVVERLHKRAYGESLEETQARLERERRRASLVVIKGGRDA